MSTPAAPSPLPAPSDPCPCGRGPTFSACCGPLIAGVEPAPDAERLMRSRYTAHVVGDYAYLHRTYLPTASEPYTGEDDDEASPVKWVKLDIHAHEPEVRPGVSHVDFTAHFEEKGQRGAMHEKSEFLFQNGNWIFSRALREGPAPVVNKNKVGRNDPCPCGSGKKYKKCCG